MATLQVSNFSELKAAIEDETTTEIYVNSNITFDGGARVNVSKSSLVINFNGFTVTDNNNSNFTDTIYIASTTNTVHVKIENAIWSGRNYYGVVGVYNGNSNSTIELVNITYTGPQFVYNKNGTTIINNCVVTLDKNGSSTNPQEFCEGNRINILGNVTVVSNSSSDAIIWFTGAGAALIVDENSVFDINASSTYFLYTDVSPNLLFKKNSSTKITTKNGLFYASGSSSHIASSFILEENAKFVAHKMNSNSIPMFKCLSDFVLKENSTFQLFSEVISSTPLMYFGQTANVQFMSPRNVVLYNRGGNIFSFQTGTSSKPNTIQIDAEMLRFWDIATFPLSSAGGFSDTPTSQFYKAEYAENLAIIATATNSQLINVSSNLNEGDIGFPLGTSSFKLLTSNVISMGKIELKLTKITDNSRSIGGITESNANVQIEFDGNSNSLSASDDGSFVFPLENKLEVGIPVVVSVNKQFLTKVQRNIVLGSLLITKITPINFFAFASKGNQTLVYRQEANWELEITDTRSSGGDWFLYAYIQEPLTSNTNILDNVLIFKENGKAQTLSKTPILIYEGNGINKKTTISWKNIEGFLLQINPEIEYEKGEYQTEILWEITTQLI